MATVPYFNTHRRRGLSAAAAELRQTLQEVQALVKQGRTSGAEWEQADVRQRNATHAWQSALREVAAELPLLRQDFTFGNSRSKS